MAWNRIGNFAALSLAFIFAACGGDSGNNAKAPEEVESVSSSSKNNSSNEMDENCFDKYNIDGEKIGYVCNNGDSLHSDKPLSSSFAQSSSSLSSSSALTDENHFIDDRDGLIYKKVTIGSQIWMAENLRLETENSSCWNFNTNCSQSGNLYKWSAAIDSAGVYSSNGKGCGLGKKCSLKDPIRGACPAKWHVPTKDEFEELFIFIGGQSVAGKILKSTNGWSQKGNGIDKYDFSAFPTLYPIRANSSSNEESIFWTSTKSDNNIKAYTIKFSYQIDSVDVSEAPMRGEFSIRCVFDEKKEISSSSKASSSSKGKSSSSKSSSSNASIFEQDTYGWSNGIDGEIKAGNVTKNDYIYDAQLGVWREASSEEYSFGGCTEAREKEIAHYSNAPRGLWFICKSREWVVADTIEVDTHGWKNGIDGEIKKGDSTDVFYKYDEILNEWLIANKNDTLLKFNGCTTKLEGSVKKSSVNNSYYECEALNWNDGWIWSVPKEYYLNPNISYGTMVDSRDGKTYKTIKIGKSEWMAENLNYADSIETKSLLKSSWCYNNVVTNCNVAGRLYTWAAAYDSLSHLSSDTWEGYNGPQSDPKGCGYGVLCGIMGGTPSICPSGWRLPMESDIEKLWNVIGVGGSSEKANTLLKSQKGWDYGENGSDTYGFSALPVGMKNENGEFVQDGGSTCFWSAQEYGAGGSCKGADCRRGYTSAYAMCYGSGIAKRIIDKRSALSVRCVK